MGVSMIQIGDGIFLVSSWVLSPKFHLKLIVISHASNIVAKCFLVLWIEHLKMGIIYLAPNLGKRWEEGCRGRG
jgi:hypothetical protein